MKNLVFLVLLIVVILSGCQKSLPKMTMDENKRTKVVSSSEENITGNNIINTCDSRDKSDELLIYITEKKNLDKIRDKIGGGLGFYKVDCNKFKSDVVATECEDMKLQEIGKNCDIIYTGLSLDNLNTVFGKDKFPHLVESELEDYRNICRQRLLFLIKEEKQEENQERILKIVDNFKISDCDLLGEKLLKYLKDNSFDKNMFIQKCKIGYAITYKSNCKIISDPDLEKKCEKLKKDIDYYNYLKEISEIYGNFDLYYFLDTGELLNMGNYVKIRYFIDSKY